ncbi:SURF1 family protein [Wenzhouxiangella sp. AB-CW3]|uniref:SURF1 family protein n=1 Tax=Wenzhouxiangella sp. AB-CW3 TaxID=2771012 RepID=UPI00168AA7F2|nr:SURF1 family protein [Wenzhouxiangella sp. AB-CW3]QOC21163.1 SURF1 family protein [Wenzhouxiangella sp. AB-CW3]
MIRHALPHVAAALVIGAAVYLTMWQLDRAEWKSELLADWESATASDLAADEPPGRYALVEASGDFDQERHVLLDNQVRNMQPGVHVFTPFQPHGTDKTWMVNRGWQPLPRRDELPSFPTPGDSVTIAGRLSELPRVGLEIGRASELDPDHWPNLMTYFDLERIRDALGENVADRIVLLEPDHPAHLSGDEWEPVTFGPERHRAYAFQWASIGIVVFFIWLILTIRSLRRS